MSIALQEIDRRLAQIETDSLAQVVGVVLGVPVTRAELRQAFDRVADLSNWKNRIDATVYADRVELEMIREAVVFFTGSVAHFARLGDALPGSAHRPYRVRAAGYYATIGA